MMRIVDIPPPKDAQLNWYQAAPVDWSMFLKLLPLDWLATVRIALVDILDLSEVVIPAGVFLHPAVGWG